MKHLFSLVFGVISVILLSLGCAPAIQPPPTGPQLAANISNQTVALVTDLGTFDKNHQAFCTGVWLNDTTILTASHCVEGYADIQYKIAVLQALVAHGIDPTMARLMIGMGLLELADINDPDNSPELQAILIIVATVPHVKALGLSIPFVVQSQTVDVGVPSTGIQYARAYTYSSRDDLALLRVTSPQMSHYQHPHISLADKTPYVGEEIEIVGQSQSVWWSYKRGIVSAYRHSLAAAGMEEKDGPFMQITGASLVGGDSGSGVFNDRGELVGLTSFIKPSLQAGFAIHLDTIKGFLIGQHLLKANLAP